MFWNRLLRDVVSCSNIFQGRLWKCISFHNRRLHWMPSGPFQTYSRNARKNCRVTSAIKSSSSCTNAWCYQVLMLTRATALCAGIPSCFNILGDCKWFLSPLTQSCLHDTPLLSKAQQYSVSAFTGQGHGLTRSGTDLWKLRPLWV